MGVKLSEVQKDGDGEEKMVASNKLVDIMKNYFTKLARGQNVRNKRRGHHGSDSVDSFASDPDEVGD